MAADDGTVVLADSALPRGLVQRLAAASGGGRILDVDAGAPDASDLARAEALSGQLSGAERVIAVGGGTVLDLAAMGRLLTADPDAAARIRHGGSRPGLVVFPDVRRPEHCPELIAVPTTVGTAAEVSAVATTVLGGHRKLVIAPLLAADTAALDPWTTGTLPPTLLREGVLEALFRVLNSYTMEPGPHCPPTADAESLHLLGQLAAVGDHLGDAADDAAVRTDAALLSARTVLGCSQLGRDPFAGKIWYVSNELATVAGVRKMVATAATAPHLWRRALAGDGRFGQAARIRRAWEAVRDNLPGLSPDPATGLRGLAERWSVPRCPRPSVSAAALASRAVRAWGAGLPMLGALRTADLRSLYADILGETGSSEGDSSR